MSELRAALTEFLPQLQQLSGLSTRLNADQENRLSYMKDFMGAVAVDNVRQSISESGIQSRSGDLMRSVEYDPDAGDMGEISVNTPYASVLEYGADMKTYMLGKVIPIHTDSGVVFRKVTTNPTISGKNWIISSYKYFEAAKERTANSPDAVKIVTDLQELVFGGFEEALPSENMPEISIELKTGLVKQEKAILDDITLEVEAAVFTVLVFDTEMMGSISSQAAVQLGILDQFGEMQVLQDLSREIAEIVGA